MSECLCDKCAALCCQYFALEIDKPTTVEDFDNIRWYLVHQNVVVFVENKKWYLGVLNKCKNLMEDNRCAIYEERPRICRGYSTDNCDYHGGDYGYEKLFTSAEELRAYAEAKLGRSILPRKKKPRIRLKGKLGRRHVTLPVMS
jgi:Fe-S-cluster containining protein